MTSRISQRPAPAPAPAPSAQCQRPAPVPVPVALGREYVKNGGKTAGRAAISVALHDDRFPYARALRANGTHRGTRVLGIQERNLTLLPADNLPTFHGRSGGA